MAKKHKRRQRAHPDRVVAGVAEAGAAQLIELIHQLNPTGLDLSKADKQVKGHQVLTAAALSGQMMTVLSFDGGDEDNDQPLIVNLVDRERQLLASHRIPESRGETLSMMAVLQTPALVFVLHYVTTSEWRIEALRWSASGLELLYRAPVYGDAVLLRDHSGDSVGLLTHTLLQRCCWND